MFALFALFFASKALADTNIHLDIETSTGSIYNQDITVTPCNSDNNSTTDLTTTGFCALTEAGTQAGFTNNWDWSWPPGAFLNSINSVANNDNNNGIYWGWFNNSNLGATGLNQYNLTDGDSILVTYGINPLKISVDNQKPTVDNIIKFTVTQFGYDSSFNPVWSSAVGGKLIVGSNTYNLDSDGTYSLQISDATPFTVKGQLTGFVDTPEINITPVPLPAPTQSPAVSHSYGGEGYSTLKPILITKPVFDIDKATNFLLSQQKTNGSFGEDLYTDWTALALVSNPEISKVALDKITKYFSENKFSGTNITDYERHAMTLMALDLDPYNTNNENYIKDIISKFDGTQFGDKKADNDDIFALIVLQNAGYKIDDEMISADISFILSKQNTDGSWDENVDLTGAGIEALASFSSPKQGFGESLAKAEKYLKQNQKTDGSWQNVSSTAWAMQGILAQGEKMEDWKSNENSPMDYLATEQDVDGGMKDADLNSRIWKTSYALTSASGKTWNQIMQKFSAPAPTNTTINTAINPLQTTIQNSYQNSFINKINKFKKPTEKIQKPIEVISNTAVQTQPTPAKKQGFFRKLLKMIFGL